MDQFLMTESYGNTLGSMHWLIACGHLTKHNVVTTIKVIFSLVKLSLLIETWLYEWSMLYGGGWWWRKQHHVIYRSWEVK